MTKQGFVKIAAMSLILGGGAGPASAQRGEEPPYESPDYQVQVVASALYTAPLTNFSHEKYDCSVVNVGKNPIGVKVQIFMENGADISADVDLPDYDLPCDGELNPGAVCHMKVERAELDVPEVSHLSAYCRIIVLGSKENVRGALMATTRPALDPNGHFVPSRSVTVEAH